MSEQVIGVIIGFAGAILGGAVTELLRGRRESRLDSQKRAGDRQIARDDFQRETLLALQAALRDWLRSQVKVYLADRHAVLQVGKLTMLPEGLSDESMEAGIQLMYLTERVTRDDLRVALGELRAMAAEREAWNAVTHEQVTADRLENQSRALGVAGSRVQELLGEVLRVYL